MKSLNDLKWEAFYIHDIFPEVQRGKRLKTEDHIKGSMAYVSSSAVNNGVDDFISNIDGVRIFNNCITLANSGSVGTAFYHPYAFVASDHVTHLKNEFFSKYIYLFIVAVANRFSEKYIFNREISDKRLRREKIMLPVDEGGHPDYAFMEEYMKHIEKNMLVKYKRYLDNKNLLSVTGVGSLSSVRWKQFLLDEIFTIKATASGIDKQDLTGLAGDVPYITRSNKNNAWDSFIAKQPSYNTDNGNVLSVGLDTLTAFYQPIPFYTGQNIQVFSHERMSKYVAMFIIPLLKKQMEKLNWGGNGATLGRLRRQHIMLPVNSQDEPDFDFMEEYMRFIEIQLLSQYETDQPNMDDR